MAAALSGCRPRLAAAAALSAAAALLHCAGAALVLPSNNAQITAGLFDPVQRQMLWGVSQPAGIGFIIQVDASPFAKTNQLSLTAGVAGTLVENLAGAWVDASRRLGYFVSNSDTTSIVRVNLDTFALSGAAWQLPFPAATGLVTAQLFDYGRNTVYLGSSAPPGRLVRFNLNTAWGLGTYTPGWVSLNATAGESVVPTSMVLDPRGVVYVGLATTPGRVVGVRVNGASVQRTGVETFTLTSGGCAAATCTRPSAGLFEADSNSSFWATDGTEGPSIVRIAHTTGVITRWAPARLFLSSQPTVGILAAGWGFWVATSGPSPTILRMRIPQFTSPSNITLQFGIGDVLAAVVDNVTSTGNGWLFAGYNADAAGTFGLIANVAAWTGAGGAAMVESVAPTPSASQTPTSTRSGSSTSTGSTTSSANATDSRSRSVSAAPVSASRSVSASVAGSPAPTGSRTGTASTSDSAAATRSSGGTASITNSPDATRSRTGPGTPAPTGTGTRTSTPTATPTRSSSQTGTRSITATGSRSGSPPPTPSRTGSPPPTVTPTPTGTPVSPTSSKSAGASSSGSPSLSGSNTMSASESGSTTASISETATASGTPPPLPVAHLSAAAVNWDGSMPSPRSTPSNRPSPSPTHSPTGSGSAGASASVTAASSATASVSASPAASSPAGTVSWTSSASATQAAATSPSLTASASETAAVAASSSNSPSGASSASESVAATASTASESVAATAGAAPSSSSSPASASGSVSATASAGGSGGGGGGGGAAPSSTSGTAPSSGARLLRRRGRSVQEAGGSGDGGAAPPLTLVASEAWLPTPFVISADIAPGRGETVTVRCESLNPALRLVVTPVAGYSFSLATLGGAAAPPPRLAFNVTALFTEDQAAIDNEPDSWSPIECSATSVGEGLFARQHFASTSPVELRVSVLRARWPLLQDAIVHLAKDGLVKSVFERNFTDIHEELFIGCSNDTERCPPTDLEAALNVPEAVEYALNARGLLSGPQVMSNARARPFDMQLSGATHVTLVADALFWYKAGGGPTARFVNTTTVAVAGVPCNVTWISADGRLLHMITPSISLVCVRGEECGYKPFTISAGAGTFGARADGSDSFAGVLADASDSGNAVQQPPSALAGALSCPPFCPAQAPGTVPTVASMLLSGSAPHIAVVPGRVNASTGAVSTPSTYTSLASSAVALAPKGIYFSAQCPSIYVKDPTVCSDVENPSYVNCAFGEGDDCQRCPTGAYCPGGYRAVVLPGYYITSLDRLPVIRCSAPAEERCVGWNATANAVQCGVGYRPGSYRCQSCAKGFFVASDGGCDECPPSKLEQLLQTLMSFVASLIAFGVINYLFILAIAKYVGGTVAGGAKAALQLMIWTFTVIQTIVQVGKGASPGLPGFLRQAYAGLDVFSFGGLSPNTACLAGAYPFLNEATQMGLALGLMLLVAALQPSCRKLLSLRRLKELQRDKSRGSVAKAGDMLKPLLRRALFTVLTLMYPIVMRSSMEMLNCSSSVVSVRAYLSMDQDGSSLAGIGRTVPKDPVTGRPMTVEQLAPLSDVDKSVRTLLDAALPVNSLVSNSYFVCKEGAHAPVWALAWVALLLYGVGYPLGTFLLIRSRLNRLLQRHRDAARAAGKRSRVDDRGFCMPSLAWLLCGVEPPAALAAARALGARLQRRKSLLLTAGASADAGGSDQFVVGSMRRLSGAGENGGARQAPSHASLMRTLSSASLSSAAGEGGAAGHEAAESSSASSRRQPPAMSANPMMMAAASSRRLGGAKGAAAVAALEGAAAAEQAPAAAPAVAPSSPARWQATLRRYALCERRSAAAVKEELAAARRWLDPVSRYLDSRPELLDAVAFNHFTASDYRPSAFYFRNLDMALLFVLSALLVFWRRAPDDSAVYAKMLMTLVSLMALAMAIARVRPFNVDEVWKQWVKIFSLVLSMFAGILNGLTGFVEHAVEGGVRMRTLRAGITGLSYVVFLMSVGLFLMLLGGFWYALVERGRTEAEEARLRAAAAAAVALRRVVGGGMGSASIAPSPKKGAVDEDEEDPEGLHHPRHEEQAQTAPAAGAAAAGAVKRVHTGLSLAQLLVVREAGVGGGRGGAGGGGGSGAGSSGSDVDGRERSSSSAGGGGASGEGASGSGGAAVSAHPLDVATERPPSSSSGAAAAGDGSPSVEEGEGGSAAAATPVSLAQALNHHAPADRQGRASMIPSMVSARGLFRR